VPPPFEPGAASAGPLDLPNLAAANVPSVAPVSMFESSPPATAMPDERVQAGLDVPALAAPRKRSWVALAALGAAAAVALASTYLLRDRPPSSDDLARTTLVEVTGREATEAPSNAAQPPAAASTEEPSRAPSAPGVGAASTPGAASAPAEGSAPQPAQGGGAARSEAAASAAAATGAEPESFVLSIHSKPSRARVFEKGKYVGRTPLQVRIERASVASEPREFLVQQTGYFARRVIQADSAEDVRSSVKLKPKPPGEEGAEPNADDVTDAAKAGSKRPPSSTRPSP
jgi:hypothetical protein